MSSKQSIIFHILQKTIFIVLLSIASRPIPALASSEVDELKRLISIQQAQIQELRKIDPVTYLENVVSEAKTPDSYKYGDLATLILTRGVWDVQASVYQWRRNSTQTIDLFQLHILSAEGDSNTGQSIANSAIADSAFRQDYVGFTLVTPSVRVVSDGKFLKIANLVTEGQTVRAKYFPGAYSGVPPFVRASLRASRVGPFEGYCSFAKTIKDCDAGHQ